MRKFLMFFLAFFVHCSLFLFSKASGEYNLSSQENGIKSALEIVEVMKGEIQQAHAKLAKAREGDDLSVYTVTVKSVPNLMRQFRSLSECTRTLRRDLGASSELQNLSSDLLKTENVMKELDRVSKLNLKSASQDQLNKLSLALDAMEKNLSETEEFVVRSKIENLKKSLQGDVEDMEEEVKDAFDRLAKAKEGDDLYEICLTRKNLPNLKKYFDSISQKIKEAKENFQSTQEIQRFSSDISKIGTILQELERAGRANLKAGSEAQLKKLSDRLTVFRSKIK